MRREWVKILFFIHILYVINLLGSSHQKAIFFDWGFYDIYSELLESKQNILNLKKTWLQKQSPSRSPSPKQFDMDSESDKMQTEVIICFYFIKISISLQFMWFVLSLSQIHQLRHIFLCYNSFQLINNHRAYHNNFRKSRLLEALLKSQATP